MLETGSPAASLPSSLPPSLNPIQVWQGQRNPNMGPLQKRQNEEGASVLGRVCCGNGQKEGGLKREMEWESSKLVSPAQDAMPSSEELLNKYRPMNE